jgi:hypothetical protein
MATRPVRKIGVLAIVGLVLVVPVEPGMPVVPVFGVPIPVPVPVPVVPVDDPVPVLVVPAFWANAGSAGKISDAVTSKAAKFRGVIPPSNTARHYGTSASPPL